MQTDSQTSAPKLDLQDSILILINFLGNKITASGSATYRSMFDLNINEFRILVMLAAEPNTTGQRISDFIGMDPGAASRTLKSLESRGLVVSRHDPRNGAYRCWSMTAEGAALQDRAVLVALRRTEILLKDFSEKERNALVLALRKMIRHIPDLFLLAEHGSPGED